MMAARNNFCDLKYPVADWSGKRISAWFKPPANHCRQPPSTPYLGNNFKLYTLHLHKTKIVYSESAWRAGQEYVSFVLIRWRVPYGGLAPTAPEIRKKRHLCHHQQLLILHYTNGGQGVHGPPITADPDNWQTNNRPGNSTSYGSRRPRPLPPRYDTRSRRIVEIEYKPMQEHDAGCRGVR